MWCVHLALALHGERLARARLPVSDDRRIVPLRIAWRAVQVSSCAVQSWQRTLGMEPFFPLTKQSNTAPPPGHADRRTIAATAKARIGADCYQ